MPIVQLPYSESVVVLRCHGAYRFSDVMDNIESAAGTTFADCVSLIFAARESTSPRTTNDFSAIVKTLGGRLL